MPFFLMIYDERGGILGPDFESLRSRRHIEEQKHPIECTGTDTRNEILCALSDVCREVCSPSGRPSFRPIP